MSVLSRSMLSRTSEAGGASASGARSGLWDRLYGEMVDVNSSASFSSSYRMKRWQLLNDRFPDLADMKVIDLGGTAESWMLAPRRPAHVTLVNVLPPTTDTEPWFDHAAGSACDLPASLTEQSWDLVFSNSVIEHVGGHQRCLEFAASARSLSASHWIQTPYRYFPIEPHFLFPGLQFLPQAARATVIRRWPLNKWRPDNRDDAVTAALDVELLGRTELRHYFPDSEILAERVGGLTKSLIAVRSTADASRGGR